jgi:xylan 1,4-beta-xylosidase
MATNPENAYRNGTMYSSYTAASFAREYELEDKYGINFLGSVSWSFEFENQPWFYGYRELATNGVDKPVLNVFRMLGKMGGDRVEVKSNRMYPLKMIMDSGVSGRATDIGALASSSDKSAAVMIWNYHDEDKQGAVEPVSLTIKGIAAEKVLVTQYRIDRDHSNSYQAWKKMGSPQNPTKKQIAELEKAGQLEIFGSPEKPEVSGGVLATTLNLPRQGVALIKLNWL